MVRFVVAEFGGGSGAGLLFVLVCWGLLVCVGGWAGGGVLGGMRACEFVSFPRFAVLPVFPGVPIFSLVFCCLLIFGVWVKA